MTLQFVQMQEQTKSCQLESGTRGKDLSCKHWARANERFWL